MPEYRFDPLQALRDFQNGPDIPRPNILAQQIPVVGSAWQAVGDLQDGNYGAAAPTAAWRFWKPYRSGLPLRARAQPYEPSITSPSRLTEPRDENSSRQAS